MTPLTTLPHDTGDSVVKDLARSTPREDDRLESPDRTIDQGAANQNKPSWMSSAYSSTKVAIDVVKESSDVFPPLKSVAGGLAVVLKHYDVMSLSSIPATTLTIALASNGQQENSSIIDTPD